MLAIKVRNCACTSSALTVVCSSPFVSMPKLSGVCRDSVSALTIAVMSEADFVAASATALASGPLASRVGYRLGEQLLLDYGALDVGEGVHVAPEVAAAVGPHLEFLARKLGIVLAAWLKVALFEVAANVGVFGVRLFFVEEHQHRVHVPVFWLDSDNHGSMIHLSASVRQIVIKPPVDFCFRAGLESLGE